MNSFLRIRNSHHFKDLFDKVSPLFWLVLLYNLRGALQLILTEGRKECWIVVTWWGGVRITYLGDRNTRPFVFTPEKPRWDDPVWASSVPACLASPSLQSGEAACHLSAHASLASQNVLSPPQAGLARAGIGLAGPNTS